MFSASFNKLNNQLLNDVLRFLGNYIFLQMNYKIKIEEQTNFNLNFNRCVVESIDFYNFYSI